MLTHPTLDVFFASLRREQPRTFVTVRVRPTSQQGSGAAALVECGARIAHRAITSRYATTQPLRAVDILVCYPLLHWRNHRECALHYELVTVPPWTYPAPLPRSFFLPWSGSGC